MSELDSRTDFKITFNDVSVGGKTKTFREQDFSITPLKLILVNTVVTMQLYEISIRSTQKITNYVISEMFAHTIFMFHEIRLFTVNYFQTEHNKKQVIKKQMYLV